ncbi:DUF1573 domain-containing protein [Flavihumibacter stibioxidans]|uniref:DUF1573 domain-containing protein n=1 Tax=Flavihumibacter stibioxidans TaxID=1834163 RepID=A0ABR7MBT7_9BACT|nr:DUF1573 domain-containing protein [Flavihumibacter stibioxidans]MBC6492480.1 hypothetical protein [Flavihumibacter stibioxidans]
MKKIILFCLLLAGTQALEAQTQQVAGTDPLLITSTYDFGNIRQGRPVTSDIPFTNTGKEALKIENVSASCGCTSPKWSNEPVAPGRQAFITVGYNAAAEGHFEKSVTVYYNGGKTRTFFIKGQVTKPLSPAPVNSSVQLLKQ